MMNEVETSMYPVDMIAHYQDFSFLFWKQAKKE